MRISVGGVIGIVVGLIPLVYIGWLLRHFMSVGGGTAEGIVGIGLGPTVLGLSIVGLLFALPLIIKLIRSASGVNRVPGAGFTAAPKPGEVSASETVNFDADAAFANYMRNRDVSAVPVEAPVSDGFDAGPVTPRPGGFGRKIV